MGSLGRAELNGRTGIVLKRNDDGSDPGSRWVVKLDSTKKEAQKEVAIMEGNLQKVVKDHPEAKPEFWECTGGAAAGHSLRVIGRTRDAGGSEGDFSAVVEIACRGSKNTENWITNFT